MVWDIFHEPRPNGISLCRSKYGDHVKMTEEEFQDQLEPGSLVMWDYDRDRLYPEDDGFVYGIFLGNVQKTLDSREYLIYFFDEKEPNYYYFDNMSLSIVQV